jgi:MFS superfamily sulfate permease-like transporter
MRPLKIAAIAVGVLLAFLAVSTVIGFLVWGVMAALVVGIVVLSVKVAFRRGQISRRGAGREVRDRTSSRPLRGQAGPDVDDDLARLRREMGR